MMRPMVRRRSLGAPGTPPAGGLPAFATTGTGTTGAIDTTGATLLVMAIADYTGGGPCTPTDSKSNTWTGLTGITVANPASLLLRLFYVASPTVGTLHTFSSTPSDFQAVCVGAFSGVTGTSDIDIGFGSLSLSGTIQPGSATPAHANELIVTAFGNDVTSLVPSVGSGFTIGTTSSGAGELASLAYLVQTTATAENPTWTAAGMTRGACVMGSWS